MEEVKSKKYPYDDQVEDLMFKILSVTTEHLDGMKNLPSKYKVYVGLDAILDAYLFITTSGPMGFNGRKYMNDHVDEVLNNYINEVMRHDGKEKVN
jgi:uncharacterized protein YejL (UPF0352 family)